MDCGGVDCGGWGWVLLALSKSFLCTMPPSPPACKVVSLLLCLDGGQYMIKFLFKKVHI